MNMKVTEAEREHLRHWRDDESYVKVTMVA
jgi:hypothetical protein